MLFSRRQFLKISAAPVAALAMAEKGLASTARYLKEEDTMSHLKPVSAIPRIEKPQNIAIVGAGLAGLSCAYDLAMRGHKVTIFEARKRLGGRIETVREPFTNGFFVEAGAYWLNNRHTVAWNFIEELGLKEEFLEVPLDAGYLLCHIRDRQVKARLDSTDNWPEELKLQDPEKQMGLGFILWSIFGNPKLLGDPRNSDWPPDQVIAQHGKMNFKEFLSGKHEVRNFKTGSLEPYTPSPGVIELIRPWFAWWDDMETLSALAMIQYGVTGQRLCEPRENPAKWFRTKHGMDCLPLAFQKTLQQIGVLIVRDAPVVSIKSNKDSISIQYRHPSGEERKTFDQAICTIPLTTLRNINIEPRLSDRKRALIDGVRYASVSRSYIQCKQPILDLQNSAGYTDLPIGNLLDMSFGLEKGPGRVLQGFMIGKHARGFADEMDEHRKQTFTVQQLKMIFPQLKNEDVEQFWFKCWDQDPWARGAYPAFTADQFLSAQELGRAEGRLHFAGEHTSAYSAWMEGALRSGNRAAREIDPQIKERQ